MQQRLSTRLRREYQWIIILATVLIYSASRAYQYREPQPVFGYRVLYLSIATILLTIVLFVALLPIFFGHYLEFVKTTVHATLKHPYIFLAAYFLIQYVIHIPFSRTSDDVAQLGQTVGIMKDRGLIVFFKYYTEMPWIGYQHPPLVALLAYPFPKGVAGIKITTVLTSLFTVLALFEIAKIYIRPEKAMFSALLLTNIYLFMKMAVDGRHDSLITFFFTLTILFFLRGSQKRNSRDNLIAGICAGFGLLTKYTFVLVFPILLVFCLLNRKRSNWYSFGVLLLVSIFVTLPWFTYSFSSGILSKHLSTYIDRVSDGPRTDLLAYIRNLVRVINPHLLVIALIGVFKLIKEKQLCRRDLFFMTWAFFPFLFYALTTNRLVRYGTPGIPALAIVITRALSKIAEKKRESEKYFLFGFFLGCSIILSNLLVAETLWGCCFRYYKHQLADFPELPNDPIS